VEQARFIFHFLENVNVAIHNVNCTAKNYILQPRLLPFPLHHPIMRTLMKNLVALYIFGLLIIMILEIKYAKIHVSLLFPQT
jgi:hypothetical protein